MRHSIRLVALASALAGCAVSEAGYPVYGDFEIHAMALPNGPVYFGWSKPSPATMSHEWCHIERAKAYGKWFYARYMLDPVFACQEERECGWKYAHPACKKEDG
jgi:hypothetical protein